MPIADVLAHPEKRENGLNSECEGRSVHIRLIIPVIIDGTKKLAGNVALKSTIQLATRREWDEGILEQGCNPGDNSRF
jgi:hypothetical protein